MEYPVISLFSGAMGLDLGLEAAGCDIKVGQDYDVSCAKTAVANGRRYVHGDIQQLLLDDPDADFLLRSAGLAREEVFAVVGGPPCQPFSTAGKRGATNDPRGSLFMQFCQVVQKLQPRFFVMENVKGLLSAALQHRRIADRSRFPLSPDERPGSALRVVQQAFDDLGYKTVYGVLDAVYYGVPQFRERLIILGSRDGEDLFLPEPTHFSHHQNPSYRWNTLRAAIEDLQDQPGPGAAFSAEQSKYLQLVPMGGYWKDLPDEVIPMAMGGAFSSGGGKVGFFRRLDYDQPSPTLVTSPNQKATMLCHPVYTRPLSVREYARIQQFPSSWEIEGSVSDSYRQIGNAVPIGLGQAIGQTLIAIASGGASIQTKRMRGTSAHTHVLKHPSTPKPVVAKPVHDVEALTLWG